MESSFATVARQQSVDDLENNTGATEVHRKDDEETGSSTGKAN